jgi:hypothetical protein
MVVSAGGAQAAAGAQAPACPPPPSRPAGARPFSRARGGSLPRMHTYAPTQPMAFLFLYAAAAAALVIIVFAIAVGVGRGGARQKDGARGGRGGGGPGGGGRGRGGRAGGGRGGAGRGGGRRGRRPARRPGHRGGRWPAGVRRGLRPAGPGPFWLDAGWWGGGYPFGWRRGGGYFYHGQPYLADYGGLRPCPADPTDGRPLCPPAADGWAVEDRCRAPGPLGDSEYVWRAGPAGEECYEHRP